MMDKKKKIPAAIFISCIALLIAAIVLSELYRLMFIPKDVRDIIKMSDGIPSAEEFQMAGYEDCTGTPLLNVNSPGYRKAFFSDEIEYGYIMVSFCDGYLPVDKVDIDLACSISKNIEWFGTCTRYIEIETPYCRVFGRFDVPLNYLRDDALIDELLWMFE